MIADYFTQNKDTSKNPMNESVVPLEAWGIDSPSLLVCPQQGLDMRKPLMERKDLLEA